MLPDAFVPSTTAKSTTYVNRADIGVLDPHILTNIAEAAAHDPCNRARICMHADASARVHEMLIVYRDTCYCRPHRHPPKDAVSFRAVTGTIRLVLFASDGSLMRHILLSTDGSNPFMARISGMQWYMLIPESDPAAFLETIAGPLEPDQAEYALWAPEENDHDAVRVYLGKIRSQLNS